MSICECYSETATNFLGAIGTCLGTREMDHCDCKGDKLNCDFYPEKRAREEHAKEPGYDIYYAHHQWKYGTKIEQYELDVIRRYFPNARICNPSVDIPNEGRTEVDIMRDCLSTVKKSDIIVFSAVDGCVGSGVYKEVTYADTLDKIIFFIHHDQLISGKGYSLKRVKSEHGDRIHAYVVKED